MPKVDIQQSEKYLSIVLFEWEGVNTNMSNLIVIKTDVSKDTVINRISSLTGSSEIELITPFSGSVNGDRFRINRFVTFPHPFVPVAKGCVKNAGAHSTVELTFVPPWLGHAAICTVFVVYASMVWPVSWEDSIGAVAILLIWGLLLHLRTREKKDFIKTLKANLGKDANS